METRTKYYKSAIPFFTPPPSFSALQFYFTLFSLCETLCTALWWQRKFANQHSAGLNGLAFPSQHFKTRDRTSQTAYPGDKTIEVKQPADMASPSSVNTGPQLTRTTPTAPKGGRLPNLLNRNGKCVQEHEGENCNNEPTFYNCGRTHAAVSSECPRSSIPPRKKETGHGKKNLHEDQPAPEHRGQYPSNFGQRRLSREEKT